MFSDNAACSPDYVLAAKHALARLSLEPWQDKDPLVVDGTLDHLIHSVVADARQLRRQISERRFKLFFQPIVRLEDEQIVHHEVLIRFDGAESPVRQILLAEEMGFICELDEAVLNEAIEMLDRELRLQPTPLALAVNISAKSLIDTRFSYLTKNILNNSRISPQSILFEITESADITNIDLLSNAVIGLRNQGFAIGLDDFGSGTSSFGRLAKLPLDFVKLDRSLVRNLQHHRRNQIILGGVRDICSQLDMSLIGEGVETPNEAHTLRTIGVDAAQGWLFGKPHPSPLT